MAFFTFSHPIAFAFSYLSNKPPSFGILHSSFSLSLYNAPVRPPTPPPARFSVDARRPLWQNRCGNAGRPVPVPIARHSALPGTLHMSQDDIDLWIQQIRGIMARLKPRKRKIDSKTRPFYELHEVLGHGGMGAVFLATLQPLDVPRALKILRVDGQTDQEHAEKRFLREAHIMGNLRHPAAVKALDYQVYNFQPKYDLSIFIYAMEPCLVEKDELPRICTAFQVPCTAELEQKRAARHGSVSLQTFLDIGCVFPERTVARFARELIDVLRSAHEQRIVHRDVKPSNILVGPDGRLRLTDFGISKTVSSKANVDNNPIPAQSGEPTTSKGTAGYAAPEQWNNAGTLVLVDTEADYYSLGVVLYQLLTGNKPNHEQPWQNPSTLATGISPHWDILLRGMLRHYHRLANPDLLDYEFAEIEAEKG